MKEVNSLNRLYSLDALRGFDMFWITGGGSLFTWIGTKANAPWLKEQMEHVAWEGFRFFDLIFPLFMFISGVAIVMSVESKLEKVLQSFNLSENLF
jgi:predicted acyltransferase